MNNAIKKLIACVMAIVLCTCTLSYKVLADDTQQTTSETSTTTESTSELTTQEDITIPGGSEGVPEENENIDPDSDEYVPEQSEDELNNHEQQLEEELNKTDDELATLDEDDQRYVELIDKKIGYINAQLMVFDNQVMNARGNVSQTQSEIDELSQQISDKENEYNQTVAEYEEFKSAFTDTYNKYCQRARMFYVTGPTSIIEILFTSDDLSQFLTRLQLLSVLNQKDGEFLDNANNQMYEITQKKERLEGERADLDTQLQALNTKQSEQNDELNKVISKQEQITQKKLELSQLKAKYPQPNGQEGDVFNLSNEILNMTYPVPSQHSLSLGYGHYSDGRPHRALDFPLSMGARVVAAQKGIVMKAVDLGNRSYGRYVMIYHGTDTMGREIVTLYAHNSELLVTPGQIVTKGQQIARGGTTGNSTGPHCHFELRVDKKLVNPIYFLS